jgi:hypothetical protein
VARGLLWIAAAIVVSMMPHKFFAAWLVVLIIVPFTAPFSICDLASIVGSSPGRHAPFRLPPSATVSNDAAVSSVPCISTAGRVRLSPLSGIGLAVLKTSSTSARFMGSGASAARVGEHIALSTILRI